MEGRVIIDMPDDVNDNHLEEAVAKILTDVHVNVEASDVETCHSFY